jgi:PAS domain S-box-containing protein
MKSCVSGLGETLFQTSQNIVLVVTEDEIIKAINPAALNHLGYQEDDIIGQPLSQVLDFSSQMNAPENGLLQFLISRTNVDGFLKVRPKSGRSFQSRIHIGDKTKCQDAVISYVICISDNGELHRMSLAHNEHKNLMQSALEAIPEGVAIYDPEDRLQVFNENYANIFEDSKWIKAGTKFEDILRYGQKQNKIEGIGEGKKAQEQWVKQRLLEHQDPTGPLNQVLKNGRIIRVDERKLHDGRIVSMRTDITQLVQSKSVAESLGEVLDNIAAPVIFTNIETNKLEYANKALLKKLQYTFEEFQNLGPKDITRGIEPHKVRAFIQRVVHNPGTVQQVRITHVRKDGSTYPCIVNSICEVGDNPKRIISFIEDESVEMQIREELMMRTVEQETIIHNLPGFITHAKPDTTIPYSLQNPRFMI